SIKLLSALLLLISIYSLWIGYFSFHKIFFYNWDLDTVNIIFTRSHFENLLFIVLSFIFIFLILFGVVKSLKFKIFSCLFPFIVFFFSFQYLAFNINEAVYSDENSLKTIEIFNGSFINWGTFLTIQSHI